MQQSETSHPNKYFWLCAYKFRGDEATSISTVANVTLTNKRHVFEFLLEAASLSLHLLILIILIFFISTYFVSLTFIRYQGLQLFYPF